jgi:hypothetical protein
VKNAHNRGWWYSLLLVVSRPWSVVRGWPFRENGKKRDERSHCGRREDGGRENAPNEPTTIQESVTNEPKLVRHRLPGARRGNEPSDRTGHRSQVACGKQDQSMKHFCETNPLRPATSRRTNPRSVRCPLSVVRCPSRVATPKGDRDERTHGRLRKRDERSHRSFAVERP